MTSALKDYKWVIKVLDSSKTIDHLKCSEKCFNLWDMKYVISGNHSVEDFKSLKRLRNNFWSKLHNKRINIVFKKRYTIMV
jgi:hypothetical protein